MEANTAEQARRIILAGRVQGVGYRPFVYRLALRFGLRGQVRNELGKVLIEAEGLAENLDAFSQALIDEAPPLAQPEILRVDDIAGGDYGDFKIADSRSSAKPDIHLPPDHFCCDDCLRELHDPGNRRHRYPFINCTQCGPRYTLIARLPYDRANTSMAGFALCEACRMEYENPADRRFHAEPTACAVCGPRLSFEAEGAFIAGEGALEACLDALRAGHIIAVKGIGGYHLLCDAMNASAIAALRARKNRPHKPLAVLFPWRGKDGLDAVQTQVVMDAAARAALISPMRPVVLCARRDNAMLPDSIAPGLGEIGVMLPYSPLHHLLADGFGGPLVATSANISGEPVLTRNEDVVRRLDKIADAFLHHDRPILRPADDTVMRVIAGKARPLRVGRGMAPLERVLPFSLERPTLAVGGHMKNAVALAWENRVLLSPHIGDLDSPRGVEIFEQVIADLQQLYGVRAARVACDAHPDYASSRWARSRGLPVFTVQHHATHASALAGEFPEVSRWLVFTWDGVGLGEDGTLWGGEALLGQASRWQRVASFRPFRLPGGERAGREPWRAAAGLCWEAGMAWPPGEGDHAMARAAWEKGLNSPATSAVGRLFDGAAALLGRVDKASFEGQGPMWLEASASGEGKVISLPLARDAGGVWRSDWSKLVAHVQTASRKPEELAMDFHVSLARALLDQCNAIASEQRFDAVGLTGGVFQNKRLCELVLPLLQAGGYPAHLPEALPCNDAGLAFGQIIHVGAQDHA